MQLLQRSCWFLSQCLQAALRLVTPAMSTGGDIDFDTRCSFDRWIRDTCCALSNMMAQFSLHGRGPLPEEVCQMVERDYLTYRSSYNGGLDRSLKSA